MATLAMYSKVKALIPQLISATASTGRYYASAHILRLVRITARVIDSILMPYFSKIFQVYHLKDHIYIGLIIFGFFQSLLGDRPGAIDVCIPAYDNHGRLHWELQAKEVEVLGDKKYNAKQPVMRIVERNRPVSKAYSASGTFDLGLGTAFGKDRLVVDGEGFEAEGRQWSFEEVNKGARNRLEFSEDARVAFAHEVGNLLALGPEVPMENKEHRVNRTQGNRSSKELQKFPTIAQAKKFELVDLGKGRHKFLLEENVHIEMEFEDANLSGKQLVTISCESAVIDLGKEDNASSQVIGKIVRIHAKGKVQLTQPGRSCVAENLVWNAKGGEVLLDGGAVVSDEHWGEAIGERIILHKEDGRAEVIGGKKGRSKLSLPGLPAFSFPKLSGPSK
jgi:hypothetical protein